MVETIPADELRDRLDSGEEFALVDTRDAESYDSWRIPGAIRYRFAPGDDLDAEAFQRETGLEQDDQVVTVCAKGVSSKDFAEELVDAGYERVTVVDDGMRGWSRVYDVVDVPVAGEGEFDVVQFQRRAKGCLTYLVGDPETEAAAVMDPTRHVDEFADAAEERGYEITRVLDTHVHADHVSGGRALADAVGATYHLGAGAADRDVRIDYEPLGRNEVVDVGAFDVKAVATPGHTSEAVSYLVEGDAVLTGDTLFVDSVGRTELQFGEGDAGHGARLLYQSIHGTLLALPDDVSVLPGHFALDASSVPAVEPGSPVATSVGTARTDNSLLQVDETAFVRHVANETGDQPANYEELIAVNSGRLAPGDDEALSELETGPNNCAATSD